MKRWYYRLSLRKKILYSELFLFIISFLVLGVFAVLDYRQVRRAELSYMRQYNQQLGLNLDTMLSSADSLRYFHLSDNKLRRVLLDNDGDVDPEGYREAEGQLREKLSLLADMGSNILRANIITADGRIYDSLVEDSGRYHQEMSEAAEEIEWQEKDQCYFTGVRKEKVNLVEYDVISMICRLWDVNRPEPVGFLYLDLDFGKISNRLFLLKGNAGEGDRTEFMIVDREGILFDSGREPEEGQDAAGGEKGAGSAAEEEGWAKGQDGLAVSLEQLLAGGGEGNLKLHGSSCPVFVSRNSYTGWYLVQYIPARYLAQTIMSNMWLVLVLILAVLLVTVSGSYFFSRQVSYPVSMLSEVMEQVAADGEEDKEIALYDDAGKLWEDEIGAMVRSYNAMASRINGNIIRTYQYRIHQKQTELKMLQHQINPHFLYNALNTISAIARLQDVEYIPEIADSLSEMFRYNIKGKDVVTLREELKQLDNYMVIQKARFPGRLEAVYEVEEELLDCRILKFVLQPIAENSFKYGFVHKREKDILKITALEDGEDMLLMIEDNGVGIDPLQASEMNREFAREGDGMEEGKQEGKQESQGIGLKNVNYRLRNYYGPGYGLSVEGRPGCYTAVKLRIKKSFGEEGSRRAGA